MIAIKAMVMGAGALLWLVSVPAAVGAQTMYKCGNNYSQVPCGPDAQRLGPAQVERPTLPPDIPPPADTLAKNLATCEAQTRAGMKDPAAAQISDVHRLGPTLQFHKGKEVAGVTYMLMVNGKNSYGGYVGEKQWACIFDATETKYLYGRQISL